MKNLLSFVLLGLLLGGCSGTTDETEENDLLDMYENGETGEEEEEVVNSEDQAEVDSVVGPSEIPDDLIPSE